MMHPCFYPAGDREYWLELWRNAREAYALERRVMRSEAELVKNWNRRARNFAHKTGDEEARKKRQSLVAWLEEKGALHPQADVLDIGSGPGNYTLAMAGRSRSVTALEPASEMVKLLQQRLQEEQVDNVQIITKTWQEVDLSRDAMEGKYDLAFASMTPGVQDPETLDKLIGASHGYCYLSAFSGPRWGQAQRELWQMFFGEEMGANPGDILYPFGLVYSMGYRPELRFVFSNWVQEEPVEKAVEELCTFFWSYLEITPEERGIITRYIEDRAVQGVYRQENRVCQGMMLWHVQEIF
jgi:SAM-dependent methyltransferase